jgi:hypothetical protein
MMKKGRMAVVVAVALLIAFGPFLYRFIQRTSITTEVVLENLRGAGFTELCGEYIVRPGVNKIKFSQEFYNDVRCFLLIKRPGDEYAIHKPKAYLTIEPPNETTLYRYSAEMRYFGSIIDAFPASTGQLYARFGSGKLVTNEGAPPPGLPKFNRDDIFVVFSYKPEKGEGFPVKITIEVEVTVDIEQTTPTIQFFTPPKKTAQQLGFTDIKEFMAYMGYELCGEFYANDTEELQVIRVVTEIDLNVGKACYMLVHPPPQKTFLISFSKIGVVDFIGDKQQLSKYLYAPNRTVPEILLYSPPAVVPAASILGQGRVILPIDVPRPYESRTVVILGASINTNDEFLDRTPILVFFAYKGDSEAIGEPFRFRLMVETEIKFYVIPAKYGG